MDEYTCLFNGQPDDAPGMDVRASSLADAAEQYRARCGEYPEVIIHYERGEDPGGNVVGHPVQYLLDLESNEDAPIYQWDESAN